MNDLTASSVTAEVCPGVLGQQSPVRAKRQFAATFPLPQLTQPSTYIVQVLWDPEGSKALDKCKLFHGVSGWLGICPWAARQHHNYVL